MTTVHAYAAKEQGGKLEPYEYELGDLGAHEVDVEVTSCGICHSDLSMLGNDWGMTEYPFVPGHEVAGRVKAVGEHVSSVKVGDRVGVGWHAGYCMHCAQCMGGDHNLCADADSTIVGRHGGFADLVRVEAPSCIKIPDGLNPDEVGPMLCGGITVFNPFVQNEISPTARVGVIGIGGLGHMALKFANAWGCHVTAFTSSESKIQQAKEMGAHDTIDSKDSDAIKKHEGEFDMILSTVNADLDWEAYISALKPKGKLHIVGATLEPIGVPAFPIILGQKAVGGSPVGSPATLADMLNFSARHNIEPTTEHFPMSKVNEAMQHLKDGKARYRIVLDRD